MMPIERQRLIIDALHKNGRILVTELGKVRFNRWGSVESLAVLALP
ncbi:hypothetical protein [Erwinia sp. V71]